MVLIDQSGGVLTLTLNRPEKKNALTTDMYAALTEAIDRASADADIRCVLMQGNGDSYTAGNDLTEFAAINAGNRERASGNSLVSALARAEVPIIAAVQGRAVGVGCTMLLHCDMVLVTADARLSTPFVNLARSRCSFLASPSTAPPLPPGASRMRWCPQTNSAPARGRQRTALPHGRGRR